MKVNGGGVYVGDMHAMQGDGEMAGHTTDVSGIAVLEISLIKGLKIDGPILLPPEEDLPLMARPIKTSEFKAAKVLARKYNQEMLENTAPLQVVGTGANLNEATTNGLPRTAQLLSMSLDEVKNRVTITGAIEIGRLPGVVTVTLLVLLKKLQELKLADLANKQYRE